MVVQVDATYSNSVMMMMMMMMIGVTVSIIYAPPTSDISDSVWQLIRYTKV